ncbi:MAG: hypothetical protein N4A31_02850 [Rickettsiales bacterium]|jgi:hypothetical protein|nr:hypothetical protein [Rickettsiales bacterium]
MLLYLQQFIYQKLDIDSIKNQVKGIYYQVPYNSYFPYIYIGEFNSKNRSVVNQEILDANFKIIIYLRDKSLKNMLEISRNIKGVLNINGEDKVVLMRCLEEKISLQNDGVTHQINMKFKAVVG